MAAKPLPDADLLRQLLRYEPDTGKLFWRQRSACHFAANSQAEKNARSFNSNVAGTEAFTAKDNCGYRQGWILGVRYRAHRVIWKMVTGHDPESIDHIDGDSGNNRWSNLRSISQWENEKNRSLYASNTSGVTGVCWRKREKKWVASIHVKSKYIYLGQYDTLEQARDARLRAERELDFHPNHGRRKPA